ncbi:MAG TPA: S41 family peptidase [Blastocatellia bacterium]|nr:S41 family peptidase [Blastocatellia bacterium]
MKKLTRLILLVALLSLGAAAQTQGPAQSDVATAPAAATSNVRQETFDMVWTTVKEKHFDPDFGGVDWDKVREQYAPKVAAVKTNQELYALLQAMLGELHQSHFQIIPPEAIVDDDSKEPKGGGVGLDIRLIDGQAIINKVEAGSKAAAAGLRPGFIIKKIDDTSVDQIIQRFSKSTESPAIVRTRITRTVIGRINGKPETTVRLAYLDDRDQPHEVIVGREKLKGEMSPRFGNFPPQYTEFETKRLEGGIGYIRFNIFVTPVMEKIRPAIRSMSDAPGIIIDLRGNPGGLGGMASGIAGALEEKQTSLGVMKMRSGRQAFIVFPHKDPYLGPLVILVDGGSASTSEIFAAGLKEIGRATIIGERTMGAALPSVFGKLPTGALFQYAIADFKTSAGVLIEGLGVKPDIEVKLTRGALLEGRDPQLDAAIGIINQKHSKLERVSAHKLILAHRIPPAYRSQQERTKQ